MKPPRIVIDMPRQREDTRGGREACSPPDFSLNSFCHFSKSAFTVDDDDDDSYYSKYGKVMMIVMMTELPLVLMIMR